MNQNCDIVRDLMPLHLDGVCSEQSSRIVEEHLNECAACRKLFLQMKNDELESAVRQETDDVIKRQAGYFKRRSAVAGAVIAGIFMIPILVCLIVNLATGRGLSWFFVVLCSLLVAASVSVVPLMVPENKGLWTLGTFTASLLLLIGVANLYTHSRTFLPAAAGILFAFAAAFLPAVIKTKPVKALNIRYKGLWVMVIDTLLFVLLLAAAAVYLNSPGRLPLWLSVALPFIGFAWMIFVICYFPKCSKLIKAGVCVIITGIIMFTTEYIVNGILGTPSALPRFAPAVWNSSTSDGNVKWIILIAAAIAGVLMIIIGLTAGAMRRKKG